MKYMFRIGTVALASLAISGCDEDYSSSPPFHNEPGLSAEQIATAELSAAMAGRSRRGIEDEILRLEGDLKGLGGIFIGPSGQVVVYMPPGANAAAVRGRLAAHAPGMRITEKMRGRLIAGDRVVVREGRWPFSKLVAWQRLLSSHIRGTGAFEVDANEATNRIRVSVESEAQRERVYAAVTQAGVPTEAVEVVVATRGVLANLSSRYRPTAGGLQIEIGYDLCTLGFNVTNDAGGKGFITASHCAGSVGVGITGAAVYQPTYGSGNQVGTVHTNPPWTQTSSYECPNGGSWRCAYADVMYVQYSSSQDWALQVARTSSVSLTDSAGSRSVSSMWTNVEPPPPFLFMGDSVDKVGRTSGWTRGTVGSTCVDFSQQQREITVLCSVRVDGGSGGGGDSGAPVFIPPASSTDSLVPHGILFAVSDSIGKSFDEMGFYYCVDNCSYWFSELDAINNHLGMNVYPAPYPYGGP